MCSLSKFVKNKHGSGNGIALATLLLLLLTSCVANKPYRVSDYHPRGQPPELNYSDQHPDVVCKAGQALPLCDSDSSQLYDLAYVEFDDMGKFWTIGNLHYCPAQDELEAKCFNSGNTQMEHAVDLITQRKKEAAPVTVITFIHGWRNNASPYDETKDKTLRGFKRWLNSLAHDQPNTAFIGVFISWRGQILPGDFMPGYWNRRNAAMRVGGTSMTEGLFRLMFATKSPESPTFSNRCGLDSPTEERAVFIVIGHSFGARILERALSQPFMAMLLEAKQEAEACRDRWNQSPQHSGCQIGDLPFRSPADLVVLMNAANDSLETKAMIEGMKRINLRVAQIDGSERYFDSPPIFVSILSQGDWATRIVMPVAQAVAAPSDSYRRSYDNDAVKEGQVEEDNKAIPEGEFYQHNDGSIPPFVTHTLEKVDAWPPCSEPDCQTLEKAQTKSVTPCSDVQLDQRHSFCFASRVPATQNETKCEYYCATVVPRSPQGRFNNTPFWVMGVNSAVIKDHTDLFEPVTDALFNAILKVQHNLDKPLNCSAQKEAQGAASPGALLP